MNKKQTFLLILFALLLTCAQLMQDKNFASTFSPKDYGTRALLYLLQGEHNAVEIYRKPFDGLTDPGNLVVISPKKDPHFNKLENWLESGNTLIVFGSTRSVANFLSTRKEVTVKSGETPSGDKDDDKNKMSDAEEAKSGFLQRLSEMATSAEQSVAISCAEEFRQICHGVENISAFPQITHSIPKTLIPIAVADSKPAVFRATVGKGQLFVFPSPEVLLNQHLDKFDNLRFAFQLITFGSPKRIYIDEFHHGFPEAAPGESKHRTDALWLLVGVLTVCLILAAFSRAVRFGPPHPETSREQVGTAELAGALGLLAHQLKTVSLLKGYYLSWRNRLEDLFGISSRVCRPEVLKGLSELGCIPADDTVRWGELLADIENADNLSHQRAEEIVIELERVLESSPVFRKQPAASLSPLKRAL